jgi:glycosyltransferase involved in cell wall biosynthesis
MRILWVKADFLHPTTRGGQIRTLSILRELHRRHEITYVGLDHGDPEGPARAPEYCSHCVAIPHFAPAHSSPGFAWQLARGLVSPLPVAVARWRSAAQRRRVEELLATQRFDSLVCDFLFPAPNIPELSKAVLFQHNLETLIWRRRAQHAPAATRWYLALQARRMAAFEAEVCRRAGHIIAVSAQDAARMWSEFGAARVSEIPTGVDLEYFAPPAGPVEPVADLVFVGSLDWMPNIDGVDLFLREILPRIRARRPDVRIALVGRDPLDRIRRWAQADRGVLVTGTVPDVRPYLWGSRVSIVPLRIGGGTRLKIYEAVAAGLPVVSTAIGAEGLPLRPDEHIAIADTPEAFAAACCKLLEDEAARRAMARAAHALVSAQFGAANVARVFEEILASGPRP